MRAGGAYLQVRAGERSSPVGAAPYVILRAAKDLAPRDVLMDTEAIIAMLREDRHEWSALAAALDARPDGPLHDPGSPDWNARDVYAHLARWINNSTDAFELWLATRTLRPPTGEDDDTINARWQADDSSLTLDEARARAQRAFDRRIRAIESVPDARWDDVLVQIARADDAHHYRAHRSYITVADLSS